MREQISAILIFALVHGTALIMNAAYGQQSPLEKSASDIQTVLIPMDNGSVNCGQLFDAVSQELHWVAGSITAFSRGMGVSSEKGVRLQPEQVQKLVDTFPDLFAVKSDNADSQEFLTVNVDLLASVLSDRKSRLRRFLAEVQDASLAGISKVAETWADETVAPPRLIVTISGLNSTATSAASVAKELHRRTNLPACVFDYPNDGPILESAGMLVLALQDLRREYPSSRISLITHSMGGLVARAALELPSPRLSITDGKPRAVAGVDQMIQICPPNHGSALAEYGPLLEPAEQLYRLIRRRSSQESRILFRSIVDGFNEASSDLAPGSRFFAELNACGRNPQIEYTIFAGNAGPLPAGIADLLGDVWERVSEATNEPAEVDRRIRDVLSCSELKRGQGDGVVSIESARLDGVADFRILEMHHLVWEQLKSSEAQNLLDQVALKLGIRL